MGAKKLTRNLIAKDLEHRTFWAKRTFPNVSTLILSSLGFVFFCFFALAMVEHFFAAVEKEFVDTNNVSDILANNSPFFLAGQEIGN